MQLHHLPAAILQSGHKRTLPWIKAIYHIRLYFIQQGFKSFLMQPASPQETKQFLQKRFTIILRVVDIKINHPHSLRKWVERFPPMLIRCHHGNVPVQLFHKVSHFVKQHPLHPPRITCRMYAIDEFH